MIGAHVQPVLPEGTIACAPGPVNAASDEFRVTVKEARGMPRTRISPATPCSPWRR
ncbi:hypothetical protein ACFQ0B_58850 [Nonomuraea thailandensis]